jgi:hypothetical protein
VWSCRDQEYASGERAAHRLVDQLRPLVDLRPAYVEGEQRWASQAGMGIR